MPRVPLASTGGYYADPNRHWSAQDCVNYLPMRAERGGTRTPDQLRQCPGLRPFSTLDGGAVRGLHNVEGKLFGVAGTSLVRIKPDVVIPYGTVPGTARVGMAHNQHGAGNELLVVNGSAGYVLDTATLQFAKVTDEGYPGAVIAAYIDQYLAQVEPQGRYWFHSDLADAHSYNTLDQYEAEADPDRIVSLFVSHREVLVFGKDTIEPFVNTGAQTGTFERASNTVIECGCAARFSVVGMDNSVFFLDDKRVVRRLDGYTPVRISTSGIEQALAECDAAEISRAFAFAWEDRGHKVYYLTVPGRFTFGFDVLSGEWHRRISPGMATWRLTALVFWEGQWIGGDAQGRLYSLDWDYHYDGQEELIRERITGVLHDNQNPITVNAVELLFSTGGEASTLDEWGEQPASPTITGDAPDDGAGLAYSYAYTLGSGTPPYSVALMSGALPTGLSISTAGVLSGLPTVLGEYAFTLRVTDANGLWDEVEDTVEIGFGYLALLHLDGGLTDETGRVWTNGTTDTAHPKFGSGSAHVLGHLQNLLTDGEALFEAINQAGQFTLDLWGYPDSSGSTVPIIAGYWNTEGTRSLSWGYTVGGEATVFASDDGTAYVSVAGEVVIPEDEQVNLRLCWDGERIYQFVNGVLDGSVAFAGPFHIVEAMSFIVGGNVSTAGVDPVFGWYGWIDEIAILPLCLTTESYTPRTEAWPNPL